MSTSWSTRVLLGGLVVVGAYGLIPAGPVAGAVYSVVAASSVVAVVVGVRTGIKRDTLPWKILGAALLAWTAGDVYTGVLDTTAAGTPFPSWADAGYVLGYVLIVAALLSARDSVGRLIAPVDVLDAAMTTAGVGLTSWVFVSAQFPDTPASVWLGLFYTEIDVFVLVLVLSVFLRRRAGTVTLVLVGVGLAVMVVADYGSYVWKIEGTAETVLNMMWLTSYVLFGAAAVRPERPRPAPTFSRRGTGLSRLALITLAVALTPTAMTLQLSRGVPASEWGSVAVVATAVMVVVGSVRVWMFLQVLGRQAEALRESATTDRVTGLATRNELERRLSRRLATDPWVGLVLVDLHGFADVNATFGYTDGDRLLRTIGERLLDAVPPTSVVGRLGGDEFAVVAGPLDDRSATEFAAVVRAAVTAPIEMRDMQVTVDCSIGVALRACDGSDTGTAGVTTAENMIQRAHAAVGEAQRRHPRVAVYDRTMETDQANRLRRLGELEVAMRSGELDLFYQPRLDLRSGRVSGLEALLRWRHPVDGLLGPADFLAGAEATSIIGALTSYVLDRALGDCARWRAAGLDVDVAVNLSVRNLVDSTLPDQVSEALSRYDVPPSAVVLEVTETSAMTDPTRAVITMNALRALGVTLSIDDFGTGYSSLAYLSRLPVQQLKLDRSLVASIVDDEVDRAIVASTVDLARRMRLHLVAEGVEDAATLEMLRHWGCDAVQGFFVSRPVPVGEVTAVVRALDAAPV
ncbi:putative bifunctional diguanylate cyclase/phosphodiesterase [Rhodococcoides corynebacterioides]|uniref:GGDEF domain-containing protein n=1 Tax=Rhodococcoides corynebacterioides TaxID=53972 RepID=A0ABS7P7M8_9NOCA|nr:bifunctional diguanylate cyclase/phosphodiesterase [Rhodococcus corynebacterioides]MBY6368427.1 GGDEF domain-containing protein [Rhodococcus corynebacterioides]MBY6409773.1 GGDEF domain-containing protein [Rhodococcus corynebacterioides]